MKKGMGYIAAILKWLRGLVKRERYADRPEWLQRQMLDRAVTKRRMRERKRLEIEKRKAA